MRPPPGVVLVRRAGSDIGRFYRVGTLDQNWLTALLRTNAGKKNDSLSELSNHGRVGKQLTVDHGRSWISLTLLPHWLSPSLSNRSPLEGLLLWIQY